MSKIYYNSYGINARTLSSNDCSPDCDPVSDDIDDLVDGVGVGVGVGIEIGDADGDESDDDECDWRSFFFDENGDFDDDGSYFDVDGSYFALLSAGGDDVGELCRESLKDKRPNKFDNFLSVSLSFGGFCKCSVSIFAGTGVSTIDISTVGGPISLAVNSGLSIESAVVGISLD
ncbi:hypothetical protein DERP_013768 [Dermatophagoides pteronyssinus]|uniref:Uncharacterized protein n=1 Tax=Dermatophagoides pteronyssinus TaxID=6956 RepID=A0ABQ8JFF4_DERPT|nr:hypothetical protein DERP_013768 [Dermatophagoides pteronyssinus]